MENEQIKEMTEVIASIICEIYRPDCDEYVPHDCGKCFANSTQIMCLAEDLYNAGYRKMTPKFVLCPKGWQGVRQTRYYCPACKKMTRDHEKFCHTCGQAVKYPKVVVSKAENKLVLDWSDTK